MNAFELEQGGVLDRAKNGFDPVEHLVDVFLRLGHEFRQIDGVGIDGAHGVDDELQRALVVLDPSLEAEESALGHLLKHRLGRLPDPAEYLSGTVAQHAMNVERPVAGRSEVFGTD